MNTSWLCEFGGWVGLGVVVVVVVECSLVSIPFNRRRAGCGPGFGRSVVDDMFWKMGI